MDHSPKQSDGTSGRLRLAHRLAQGLVAATLLLISVGGLVTTYQAGMAVPDWPNTYGYNLFLYPWQTWLAGPWDLFVEHGHRLLGAAVGMMTIALVVLTWTAPARRSVQYLALACLGLVIFQGLLGGARVLLDRQLLALLHGCTAPLFLGSVTVLALFLDPRSSPSEAGSHRSADQRSAAHRLATTGCWTAGLIYLQIVLGANIRHVSPLASGEQFRIVVWFHLLIALGIVMHVVWITIQTVARSRPPGVGRSVLLLIVLIGLQIGLGLATWVVQFGYPAFAAHYQLAASHLVEAEGLWQTTITTLHVVTGSALLAAALTVTLRSALAAGMIRFGQTATDRPNSESIDRSAAAAWGGAT